MVPAYANLFMWKLDEELIERAKSHIIVREAVVLVRDLNLKQLSINLL